MTDPPHVDARRMIREDTAWYISAAFVKIFQTGAGDYWAYAAARKKRGMDVSLQTWVQHVMEGRDGRALRHPHRMVVLAGQQRHRMPDADPLGAL